ncbi:MAG: pyrroline-5-carboxylate reductase [Eubacteriales bacterium]|nr:pyrroline-5-carboxylate reductase [Eubacteriales bacterium]
MEKTYRFGVLGAGNMGMAIAAGAVRAGLFQPGEVLLFNRSADKRAAHQAQGYAVTDDYAALYAACETVLLAVKPQNFDEILPVLAACPTEKPLVLSIAAGVPFAKIEAALGADTPIIRIMPNTPLLLGEGASQLVKNAAATPAQLDRVRALFDTMGVTVVFEHEHLLNEAIPFAGSAPAYIYTFADAMVKSAAAHGLDEQDALQLFCQTLIGAAKMLLRGDQTPAALIDAVCSPGGTTIEAMRVLEQRGLYDILAEANDKCIARAYELGK